MTPLDEPAPPGTDDPLDSTDLAILAGLRELYERLDPMAPDLVDRIQFALELEDLDVEVSRLAPLHEVPAGARGEEETRTITFDSDRLTIMFSVSPSAGGRLRLDGWLAPPAAHRVELRTERGPIRTEADPDGRFAVDDVPHGLVQLVVQPADGTRTVVTSSVVL